jgi:hypothetical protein
MLGCILMGSGNPTTPTRRAAVTKKGSLIQTVDSGYGTTWLLYNSEAKQMANTMSFKMLGTYREEPPWNDYPKAFV